MKKKTDPNLLERQSVLVEIRHRLWIQIRVTSNQGKRKRVDVYDKTFVLPFIPHTGLEIDLGDEGSQSSVIINHPVYYPQQDLFKYVNYCTTNNPFGIKERWKKAGWTWTKGDPEEDIRQRSV